MNKTLPPTPNAFVPEPQLSPNVYSPAKKLPEKKGPAKSTGGPDASSGGSGSATLPRSNPLRANPLDASLTRSNSGANVSRPMAQSGKADWI